MIPQENGDLRQDFEFVTIPSKTYKVNDGTNTIIGSIDGLEALAQTVYFILSIERYEYLIYSWDYGVELRDLIGMPIAYVLPEIKRRIREALTQDDRILEVGDFEFDVGKGKVNARFTVYSELGQIEAERVVIL